MTRRRFAAVAIWAAAIGVSAYWLAYRLVVTTDLSAFLPKAATPEQSLLVAQLRDGVASRLILVGLDGSDPRALAGASRTMATALAADPQFAFVANGDAARLDRERELVWQWRYLLSPATSAERFSAEGLRTSLAEALRMLASPLGPLVKRTLPADPTGEMLMVAPLLAGGAGARTLHDGVWFSPDGRRALLVVQTRALGFDLDAQQRAARALRDAFAGAAPPDARLLMSSPGLLAVESRAQIERDARFASALTLTGVIVLLVAIYRSAWPTLLSAVPALSGLAVGIVVVGIVFGPVHGITLGFGAMLVGEAVDYPTYLFANNASGEPLASTQSRIGGTLTLAVATTACGALAMLLSGFRGLSQLGLLLFAGVVVAGVVTRYVLPALTPAHALVHKRVRAPATAVRVLGPLRRHAWIAAGALAAAAAVLFVHRDHLWDDDLANLNPVPEAMKALDRELRQQSGAPDIRYLVVASGADRGAALAASEDVARRLDEAVARGVLGGYDHAARYLPTEATQQRRRAALPDGATLRANLARAVADLPFRDDAFAPFVADVERTRAGPVLRREDLDGTALALKIDGLLVPHEGRWLALMPLSGVGDPAALRSVVGDAQLLDLKAQADALVAGYRAQSLRSTLVGLVCMLAVLYAGMRSIGAVLRLMLPVLGAVLLTAAALVAAGEKLTVFHLVSLLLVVGVGLNYALFFGRRAASPQERDLTLLSVTVASLATLCAASALALAATPVLRAIGLTAGLGAVFAFAMSAALTKEHPA